MYQVYTYRLEYLVSKYKYKTCNYFHFTCYSVAADVTSSKTTPDSNESSALTLTRYALWIEPRDVWCIKLDPIWIDFLGTRSVGQSKAVPFVDAVPITFWIHGRSEGKFHNLCAASLNSTSMQSILQKRDPLSISASNSQFVDDKSLFEQNYIGTHQGPTHQNVTETNPFYSFNNEESTSDSDSTTIHAKNVKDLNDLSMASTTDDLSSADIHVIAHVSNLVSLQIDHYQYLFLLRLAEEITELTTFLTIDSKRILHSQNENKSIIIGCVVPQVEVTLVMPSQTPGKESSGGDAESVLPDSASLGDDLHINNMNLNLGGAAKWPSGLQDQMKTNATPNTTFGSVETPSPVSNETTDMLYQQYEQQQVQYTSNPNTHGFNVQIMTTATNLATPIPQSSTPTASGRTRGRNSGTDSGLKDIGSSKLYISQETFFFLKKVNFQV